MEFFFKIQSFITENLRSTVIVWGPSEVNPCVEGTQKWLALGSEDGGWLGGASRDSASFIIQTLRVSLARVQLQFCDKLVHCVW